MPKDTTPTINTVKVALRSVTQDQADNITKVVLQTPPPRRQTTVPGAPKKPKRIETVRLDEKQLRSARRKLYFF
ncbi:SRB8 [Acrasis kona]|uniref:SRB8 n=1 Tax=Acrasis kona TaxID=1008807 RepID=A0AAW2YUA2_9EUKA